jgi:hypothetical protein
MHRIACPSCLGDGYLVTVGAPGRFDPALEAVLPSEGLQRCPRCRGEGEVEVCAACGCEPTVDLALGEERCGCAVDRLRDAA